MRKRSIHSVVAGLGLLLAATGSFADEGAEGTSTGGADYGLLMQALDDGAGGNPIADLGLNFGGWLQLGYHNESDGLFNDNPDELSLHQAWFFIEKVADGSEGFDWGFRADGMYGTDGPKTQAFGAPNSWDNQDAFQHGVYGWAIPQLYGEVAYGPLSVKGGHFYTLVGYEVVTAPDNFFYSHAYTMFNSEPFTHTGAVATYEATDAITLYGGWTAGWDTGFDRYNGGSNFLGGASVGLTEDLTLTYITTAGKFGDRGDGYAHSIVADYAITEKLNYVFQSDFLDTNADENNKQYGINQYVLYAIAEQVAVGGRFEWWKSDGNSQYEVTGGVNIYPLEFLTIRPEIRHDWNPGLGDDFTTFGIDAVFVF
jgi:hypothetical protein